MGKSIYELYQESDRKTVKDSYLMDVFDALIEEGLLPYVEDLQISNEESDSFGKYSYDSRIITINKKTIEDNLRETPFPASLQAIETIKNGIEHARNYKTLEDGREDIESTVISHALKDFAIEKGLVAPSARDVMEPFYLRYKIRENIETNPGDRMAQIRAWKYMVNLLKNQRRSSELLNARAMLYHSYNRGYKDNRYYLEAPTLRFLMDTRMLEEYYHLKRRIEREDYSFDTRLLCGLPISKEEHEKKILQKVRLQKKRSN